MGKHVLIVGGGFAGISAGVALLEGGRVDGVDLVERQSKPIVKTTGGFAQWWMRGRKFDVPTNAVAAHVNGVRIVSPSGYDAVVRSHESVAFVIHPQIFLEEYWRRFEALGGHIVTGATVQHVDVDGNATYTTSSGVVVRGSYDAIVAADGVKSTVKRILGLPEPSDDDIHIGYEETHPNTPKYDHSLVHLYIHPQLAPKGYWWVFPDDDTGQNVRVGVGVPKSVGLSPKHQLSMIKERYGGFDGKPLKVVGGHIPTAKPPKTNVYGRILLVGDAGNFCSPLHGGGIGFSWLSGILASEAISAGDLKSYDAKWRKTLAPLLARHYTLKKIFYRWNTPQFDKAVNTISKMDI
ncbi:MAG: NAD(P)/FAD-dependent oxidoreductase, partial [Thermoprotei archaeon]